jgi:hypothetical protein
MTYFLRYTENAESDLNRNASYHNSDYKAGTIDWLENGQTEKEFVASVFDCEVEEIEVAEDGYYVQVLNGLCGFELESENLEDAIEEAKSFRYNSVYNSVDMTSWAIYEGKYNDDCPEGCLFNATKIYHKNDN